MVGGKMVMAFCFSILLFACGNQNKTSNEIEKTWKTLDEKEYLIKYPHTWAVNQTGYEGTSFLLISKQISIRDFYQENVRLVEHDLTDSSISLEGYVENAVDELKNSVDDMVLTENSIETKDGDKFHKIVYSARETKHKVTVVKHYRIVNDKVYILTFSGKTLELGRYLPIAENIMGSFKIK